MKAYNVITYVVAGLVLVVAIAGVIYGVAMHQEPGLKEGVPTWPKDAFPLDVVASTYSVGEESELDDGHRGALEYTINAINRRMGFNVLEWADGKPADVVIIVGVPQDVSEDALEQGFAPDGGIYNAGEYSQIRHSAGVAEQCEIRTANVPQNLLWQVAYHAFGHCLGLAHDDYTQSIMFPRQREYEGLPPWFSDDDRALLREMYGPEG